MDNDLNSGLLGGLEEGGEAGLIADDAQPDLLSDARSYGILTLDSVVPTTGTFLGLDISKTSTGVALIEDGEISTTNLTLDYDADNPHAEALMRRQLYDLLKGLLSTVSTPFSAVVIEDVYASEFATSNRILYALNTVIDDLILDDVLPTHEFYRVQNGVWKKWLSLADPAGWLSSYNDKQKVRMLLEHMGYENDGARRGYQDRLDALGMLVGHFLRSIEDSGEGLEEGEERGATGGTGPLVPLSNILFEYRSNKEELLSLLFDDFKVEEFDARVSAKSVRKAVTVGPRRTVYVTKKRVNVGNFGSTVGLPVLPFGGYLSFWRSDDV